MCASAIASRTYFSILLLDGSKTTTAPRAAASVASIKPARDNRSRKNTLLSATPS